MIGMIGMIGIIDNRTGGLSPSKCSWPISWWTVDLAQVATAGLGVEVGMSSLPVTASVVLVSRRPTYWEDLDSTDSARSSVAAEPVSGAPFCHGRT